MIFESVSGPRNKATQTNKSIEPSWANISVEMTYLQRRGCFCFGTEEVPGISLVIDQLIGFPPHRRRTAEFSPPTADSSGV